MSTGQGFLLFGPLVLRVSRKICFRPIKQDKHKVNASSNKTDSSPAIIGAAMYKSIKTRKVILIRCAGALSFDVIAVHESRKHNA